LAFGACLEFGAWDFEFSLGGFQTRRCIIFFILPFAFSLPL
jgi:hypothetical protein